MGRAIFDGIVAGSIATVFSGAPSTLHALATGGDVLAATEAAGSLLLPDEDDRGTLVAAAVPVHLVLSAGWGIVLAAVLPRRGTVLWGALAGAAIDAFDMTLVGSRVPKIAALPRGPQFADHVAYGAIAGWVIARRRATRRRVAGTSATR